MASITRPHQFVTFLNDDEKTKLYAMAEEDGTPASAVVRAMLRAEWTRRHGEKKPKAAKAKR